LFLLENKIEGLDALAARARSENRAIDYAAPVAGLVVVDRQTLRIRLNAPDPIFAFLLASPNLGAIAHEVVGAEGNAYGQRPIGTGAYQVAEFTPGQRLVLGEEQVDRLGRVAASEVSGGCVMVRMSLPGSAGIEGSGV